jgi:4-amino-4-deoxy-L-arabinose transferase-like glycosyltransferase
LKLAAEPRLASALFDGDALSSRAWLACLAVLVVAYGHHTIPHLTMMPRVNVDEPWLMERAYQVLHTGRPLQPMLGLNNAYLLQPGYGYLVAPWFALFGVGMFQARLLAVILGLGTVLAIAGIGRRLAGPSAGLLASAFLLSDSNFLGGARMARTDIPAVFFAASALWLFLVGRDRRRSRWFFTSGLATAAAILCHGNSFWVAVILGVWYFVEHAPRSFARQEGAAYVGGVLLGLAPYLVIVAMNADDLSVQIQRFAADRVPGWRLSFLLEQIRLEPQRYRDWYFGLITDTVRNPLLRVFQMAIVGGLVQLLAVACLRRTDSEHRWRAVCLLTLAAGPALIFACFINNKALVYMPHLLLGFSLAAGSFAAAAASVGGAILSKLAPSLRISVPVAALLVVSHAMAGVVYYEKWYALTRRSELLPYESTSRTLARLLPSGGKYVFAAAQFWVPFAEQPGVTFFSHAALGPEGPPGHMWPPWARDGRPLFLIVDERQWEPELVSASGDPRWQRGWVTFITGQCRLRSYAPGSAYGTLAAYECQRDGAPPENSIAVVSDGATYSVGDTVFSDDRPDVGRWRAYVDPRAAAGVSRLVDSVGGVRVSGPRWPGLETTLALTPRTPYLLTAKVHATSPADLVYIGRWTPPEVTSLSGGASAGIVEPAERPSWFPGGHAFVATASSVRVLFYSEAPNADFTVGGVRVARLSPVSRE